MRCKCFHHGVVKALVILAWLSAFGFWWATAFKQTVLWMDNSHFFYDVVILGILVFVSKYCDCCGGGHDRCETGGANKCSHDSGCQCGDCARCK